MTKTNKIGYIGSFPIPEVIRGINSAYIHAKKVNPDVEFNIVWAYTWFDPAKEADAAKVLMAGGADIITQHTDSPAPLAAAAAEGIKGFGQASDMIKFAPNTQLTSILDLWGPYYVARVEAAMNGTWEEKNTWGGMDTGMVAMAPMTNMPADLAAHAEHIAHDIKTGKFKPFGDLDDGALATMMDYVEGLDAAKP